MKLKLILLLFVGMAMGLGETFSQTNVLDKANDYYNNSAYSLAIKQYLKVLKKEPGNEEAILKLADSYRQVNNYPDAALWYSQAVQIDSVKAITYYHFGQSLMSMGKFESAIQWFDRYDEAQPQDPRGANFANSCRNIYQFKGDSASFEALPLPINTPVADFGPAYFKKGIVFSSSRGVGNLDNFDGMPYLDLYYTEVSDSGRKFSRPRLLKGQSNTKFHEATATFDQRNNLVYFTRNNYVNGKQNSDQEGFVHLQIFYADLKDNSWSNVRSLPFNSIEYSVGHPTLSPDGQTLYFISDMPGGFGGTDIYLSTRKGDNWSTPVNMGEAINTPGDEMFPFYHPDGSLYYSTNGQGGLGGLDIYYTHYDEASAWEKPKNVGYPINSPSDDFGYIVDRFHKQGYFSSNRIGGKGNDDLYRFTILKPTLAGTVVSSEDGKPIDYARITISALKGQTEKSIYASGQGSFGQQLEPEQDYLLTIEKPGFQTKEIEVSTIGVSGRRTLNYTIQLDPPPLQLEATLLSSLSQEPVRNAYITVLNDDRKLNSDGEGKFRLFLDPDSTYVFAIKKDGFDDKIIPYVPNRGNGLETQTFLMDQLMNKVLVEGKVFNLNNRDALDEVSVRLVNQKTGEERFVSTAPDGHYSFSLEREQDYIILGEKTGFITTKLILSTIDPNEEATLKADMPMEPVSVGMSFVLRKIYYDFGKASLREDSKNELSKLANFLRDNPTLRIELSAHTDARSTDAFNLVLSQKRAETAMDFLVGQGIETSRIVATGYGEQKLLNQCKNGVECSEEDHQKNRRTEFKVIGITDPLFSEALAVDEKTGTTFGNDKEEERPEARSEKLPTGYGDPTPIKNPLEATPEEKITTNTNPSPKIPTNTPSEEKTAPESMPTEEVFSIQIGLFRNPVNPEYLGKLGEYRNALIQDNKGELFRYRVGNVKNYETAIEHLERVKKKGYKDAFIITVTRAMEVRKEEPVVEEPEIEKPVVEEPVIEEPVIEEPVVEEPKVEKPVVEEPVVEEPVIEEQVLVKEPVVEAPVVEEPEVKVPVVEKPVETEPQPVVHRVAAVEGLVYKIQIGVFSKEPPAGYFNRLGDYKSLLKVEMIGAARKYAIGNYSTYSVSKMVADDLKKRGYPDAFIVPYYHNKRITVKESLEMEKGK